MKCPSFLNHLLRLLALGLLIPGFTALVSSPLIAQSQVDADMLLAQASHARMVDGDLEDAISLYRQLASSSVASRSHVAKALVELGDTYQLLGSSEAIPAYQRVVTEFGDQPGPFQLANTKLKSLMADATAGAAGQHDLLMAELPPFSPNFLRTYDFSPDGSRMVFHAPANAERKARYPALTRELYIRDTRGSVRRPMLDDAEEWEFINLPRWSPDGNSILYSVYKMSGMDNADERHLRLYDLASGKSTQLINLGAWGDGQIRGLTWMPDGKSIVTLWYDGIRLFDLEGTLLRHFEQKVDHMTQLGNVSPDGRFLLYHRGDRNKEDHGEMDLWVFDLVDGASKQVSSEPGYEGWPVWSADGSQIYYVSGPEVARNVHRRKFGSNDSPEQVTSYSNASAIFPLIKGGQLTFTLMKDNHTVLTAKPGSESSARTVVRGSAPMLSPAGDLVYYLDSEPGKTGLWVIAVSGGSPRQLVKGDIVTPYGPKTFLAPDGKRISYAQFEGESTILYVKSTAGGNAQKIYSAEGIRHLVPSWSPDSREVAFSIDGDLMVMSADGGQPEVLASVKNWESWNIVWSPDGSQLAAFAYLEGEKSNHIMLVDRRARNMKRLTPASEDQYKEILDWHPDGKRISYMYYNTKDWNGSRLIDIETGNIKDIGILPDPMWDYIGQWGPDQRYYFSSSPRGFGNHSQVHTYDDRTGEYALFRKLERRSVGLPSWNGDGSTMAWSETEPVRQMWMITDFE